MFQSLFYWMFYFNIAYYILIKYLNKSFNPYFTGCSTSTDSCGQRLEVEHDGVSILILLDVLLQLNIQCGFKGSIFCFNPYFTGCSTSTSTGIYKNTGYGKSFNPYFTGCSTSTITYICCITIDIVFQSLFYWMFYFNFQFFVSISKP